MLRRSHAFLVAFVLAAIFGSIYLSDTAQAQYAPPSPPGSLATIGFQATGKTTWIAASTSSAQGALSVTAYTLSGQVQIYNATTGIAYVVFGPATGITASPGSAGTATSDMPVGPGAIVVSTVPAGTAFVAVVLSTSSGAVYFTPGNGI